VRKTASVKDRERDCEAEVIEMGKTASYQCRRALVAVIAVVLMMAAAPEEGGRSKMRLCCSATKSELQQAPAGRLLSERKNDKRKSKRDTAKLMEQQAD